MVGNWQWCLQVLYQFEKVLPVVLIKSRVSIEAINRGILPCTSQIIATYFLCYITIIIESFLSLLNQYLVLNLMPECRKWQFWASRFHIFWGTMPPDCTRGRCLSVAATNFNRVCQLLQNLLKPLKKRELSINASDPDV